MDYSNALGIEYRVVSESEYQGQPVRIVSGARTYSAEIEELWNAVTDAQRIARWFVPISGELKLGGRYQLEGNAGGEITRCEPPIELQRQPDERSLEGGSPATPQSEFAPLRPQTGRCLHRHNTRNQPVDECLCCEIDAVIRCRDRQGNPQSDRDGSSEGCCPVGTRYA